MKENSDISSRISDFRVEISELRFVISDFRSIERTAQILFRLLHLRILKNILVAALFNYFTQVHENHMIGDPLGLPQNMGDQDNCIIFLQFNKLLFNTLA